jgi:hypothetical protein
MSLTLSRHGPCSADSACYTEQSIEPHLPIVDPRRPVDDIVVALDAVPDEIPGKQFLAMTVFGLSFFMFVFVYLMPGREA